MLIRFAQSKGDKDCNAMRSPQLPSYQYVCSASCSAGCSISAGTLYDAGRLTFFGALAISMTDKHFFAILLQSGRRAELSTPRPIRGSRGVPRLPVARYIHRGRHLE